MAKREIKISRTISTPRSRRVNGTIPDALASDVPVIAPVKRLSTVEKQAIVDEAKARFAQAEEADRKQRERELEDLRFYAGDQWPTEILNARKGQAQTATLPAIPARPTITINKQREPVKQVLNGIRQADLGIALAPADDFGEIAQAPPTEEIELREGLMRRIQRSSEAEDARFWAAMRATIAGRGFYGVCVRYAPGKTMDREVYVERFYNQACVSVDPFHEQPDGSDADWGFIGSDRSWDAYCAEYPERVSKDGKTRRNSLVDCTDAEWRALGDESPDWFTSTKERDGTITRGVRVMNYWYTERVSRQLVQLTNGDVYWFDEDFPKDLMIVNRRTVVQKKIKWCKLDGYDLLDEADWEGPDIPIVKVMGEELQPYDNERRAQGMVRPGRGAQEGFNAMVTKQVEAVAYSPIAPFQGDPAATEGFDDEYAIATTKPIPVLHYNQYDEQGRPLNPPTRTQIDTNISAIAQSVALFDAALKSTMGTGDPELGNVAPSIKSGKALSALIGQSQLGKSDYLDNLKRSIRYEGQIINNLLYPIYGKRPGRLIRIITGNNKEETRTIAAAFQTGNQVAQPNVPQGMGTPVTPQYRLTPDANFNVVIKIQPNSDERRSQEAEFLGKIAETVPQAMGIMGDVLFDTIDQPGHKEIAERWRVGGLIPPVAQYVAQKQQGQQPLPPMVQQQLTGMKAQLDHANQLLQMADQEMKAKAQETAGKFKIAEMQEERETQRSRENNETKLAVAAIGAKIETLQNMMQVFLEERARVGEQVHDHLQSNLEHQSAMALQADQQQHEQTMSAQEHQNTLDQQQQAAALQPEPTTEAGA